MPLPTTYSWVISTSTPGGEATSAAGGFEGNRVSGDGKAGWAVPFSTDGRGRVAMTSGDNQLRKIVMLNLSDLDSANPFQGDIGMGADMIFSVASAKLRGDLRRKIFKLFRRLQLQDRARLDGSPKFNSDNNLQELEVEISYINLEEDKAGTVGLKYSLVNAVG